jgi:hypothetical protein
MEKYYQRKNNLSSSSTKKVAFILPFFSLSLNYGTGICSLSNKNKNWTFIHLWDDIDI